MQVSAQCCRHRLIMKTWGNLGELKIAIRVVDLIRMTERIEGRGVEEENTDQFTYPSPNPTFCPKWEVSVNANPYLNHMCQIFVLSWMGFPTTSQRLPKISECCRKFPKMFRHRSYLNFLHKDPVFVFFVRISSVHHPTFWRRKVRLEFARL